MGTIHQISKDILILGVKVTNITKERLLQQVQTTIQNSQKLWITTPNPEIILKAYCTTSFTNVINQSDIAIPDGIGVLAAAKYLKLQKQQIATPVIRQVIQLYQVIRICLAIIIQRTYLDVILEQISGDEVVNDFAQLANKNQYKIFLLGGGQGIAQAAADRLKQTYPKIIIATDHASIDINLMSKDQTQKLITKINEFKPHILLVAFGAPKQEQWINKYKESLVANIFMGVGGTFDQLAGKVRPAPKWMRQAGLHWVWRLIQEPSRLPRIARAIIVFPWQVYRAGERN